MPETPCLLGNQTAVFLKCAEIDCALESVKKPRTAGLCGRTAGACDCGSLSCAFIERANKGLKPPKQGMVRRKNLTPKGSFLHRRSSIHTDFSHIARKRRNARFKELWRVHTPPQPLNAHTAAHRANGAGKRGAALYGTFESTKMRVVFYCMIICCFRLQVSSATLSSSSRSGSIPSITISVPSSPARLSQTCASIKSEKSS